VVLFALVPNALTCRVDHVGYSPQKNEWERNSQVISINNREADSEQHHEQPQEESEGCPDRGDTALEWKAHEMSVTVQGPCRR